MSLNSILDWIDEVSEPEYVWFVKYLAGNDTHANRTHQAGPYIPKSVLRNLFPDIFLDRGMKNPKLAIDAFVDSHSDFKEVHLTWYNQGTRNECRLTRWGGASSPLLDPESTGALTVFAFDRRPQGSNPVCKIWICRHPLEEDTVEERVGPVEPGRNGWRVWSRSSTLQRNFIVQAKPSQSSCHLEAEEIPPEWLDSFPSPSEIFDKSIEWRPDDSTSVDDRLIKRRRCEYEVFQSIEEAVTLPLVRDGFDNLNDFIATAQTVLQRRKARAGRSLELHVRQILVEEGLQEGRDFSWQPETERGKNPDFLFPSEIDYKNLDFPSSKLNMLAVKTTARDRWRQILNEADRIGVKHLLTVQHGISLKQFNEMSENGVQLVIPEPLINEFPKSIRPSLKTFESFIGDIRMNMQ